MSSQRYLHGSDRYVVRQQPVSRRGTTLVDRANAISIFRVLSDEFGIYHPSEGKSYKGYCPFGWEHSDGGIDKAWRTYPSTNSSYCFALHGSLRPVRLVMMKTDLSATSAAKRLLERYGLLTPRHYRERFNELLVAREQRRVLGDPSHMVEALQMAVVAAGPRRQFDSDVMTATEDELERLDSLLVGHPTDEEVQAWYTQAKQRLTRLAASRG